MRIGLVTGTVGVGKTTVGFAAAERASARGVASAFVDLDGLSRLWPAPTDDPFRTELTLANLRSLVPNYQAAGASLLVLAWAIEDADDLAAVERAVGTTIAAVRLVSSTAVIDERLRGRHTGPARSGLEWHVRRAPELAAIQDQLAVATVDATGPVADVADAVLRAMEIDVDDEP